MDPSAPISPTKAPGNTVVGRGSFRVLDNLSSQVAKSSPTTIPVLESSPAKIASNISAKYRDTGPNNGNVMPRITPVSLPPRPPAPQASVLPKAPAQSTAPPAKKRRLLENPRLKEAQKQWEEERDLRTPDAEYVDQGLPSSSSAVDRKYAPSTFTRRITAYVFACPTTFVLFPSWYLNIDETLSNVTCGSIGDGTDILALYRIPFAPLFHRMLSPPRHIRTQPFIGFLSLLRWLIEEKRREG